MYVKYMLSLRSQSPIILAKKDLLKAIYCNLLLIRTCLFSSICNLWNVNESMWSGALGFNPIVSQHQGHYSTYVDTRDTESVIYIEWHRQTMDSERDRK